MSSRQWEVLSTSSGSEKSLGKESPKEVKRDVKALEDELKNRPKPEYKLTYESSRRSEALRLFMLYNKIPFEEEYKRRLYVNDCSMFSGVICEDYKNDDVFRSNWAMLRYFGVQHGMYPRDIGLMAEVDEVVAGLRDFLFHYYMLDHSSHGPNADLDHLVADHMMKLELKLENSSGPGIFDGGLSVADFELVAAVKAILSSRNTDSDMFAEAFPNIIRSMQHICTNDRVLFYDQNERPIFRTARKA